MIKNPSDLEVCEQVFAFLRGVVPDGHRIDPDHVPKLTADQAWTVLHFIQELHRQLPDHIERCDRCEELYDANSAGGFLGYGDPPYLFCGGCIDSREYWDKLADDPG